MPDYERVHHLLFDDPNQSTAAALTLGHLDALNLSAWSPSQTYFPGAIVSASDGSIYVANTPPPHTMWNNVGFNPVTDGGVHWRSGGVAWPLTASTDMGFQPDGIANTALNIVNTGTAGVGLQITADTSDVYLQTLFSGNLTLIPGGLLFLESAFGVHVDGLFIDIVATGSNGNVDITAGAGGGSIQLNFGTSGELDINGSAGTAGQKLTSQGAGLPPIWA